MHGHLLQERFTFLKERWFRTVWGEQMGQGQLDRRFEAIDIHNDVGRVKHVLQDGCQRKGLLVSLAHDLMWLVGWITVENQLPRVGLDVFLVLRPQTDLLVLALLLRLFHLVIGGTALRQTLVEHFGETRGHHGQVDAFIVHVQSNKLAGIVLVIDCESALLPDDFVTVKLTGVEGKRLFSAVVRAHVRGNDGSQKELLVFVTTMNSD